VHHTVHSTISQFLAADLECAVDSYWGQLCHPPGVLHIHPHAAHHPHHSLTRPLCPTHSLTHTLTHSLTHSHTHSPTHTHSLTHSLPLTTHSLTHSPTHPPARPPIHTHTHSPTHLILVSAGMLPGMSELCMAQVSQSNYQGLNCIDQRLEQKSVCHRSPS